MILITGGAFQGRTEYAKKRFSLSDADILDCGSCDLSGLTNARCITRFELAVKRLIGDNTDPLAFAAKLNCEVVIMTEIGCGIIPLEKSEREWREATGRAGCILADKAAEVIRMCCGIPTVIKGGAQ